MIAGLMVILTLGIAFLVIGQIYGSNSNNILPENYIAN